MQYLLLLLKLEMLSDVEKTPSLRKFSPASWPHFQVLDSEVFLAAVLTVAGKLERVLLFCWTPDYAL